jgi:hypothetical protein
LNNSERAAASFNTSSIGTNRANANTTTTNTVNKNPYILIGSWGFEVKNKEITYFDIDSHNGAY